MKMRSWQIIWTGKLAVFELGRLFPLRFHGYFVDNDTISFDIISAFSRGFLKEEEKKQQIDHKEDIQTLINYRES